ncbi:MAG: 16S rRNA (cytidine(1402)-2'-O)-methyltransferase [Magnetospirillum sp.]|nr:16S rRNA (cytidine(1402)-2'-O)-methyltransferase [Magnetospirillum sp.]
MARQRQTGATASSGEVDGGPEGRPRRIGSKPAAGLYLVATPIGNIRDITLRALDVLSEADIVACEDSRVTGKLLMLLGLKRPLLPYHEHNAEKAGRELMAHLKQGAVVALVSDAGTPLVADPGWALVRACIADQVPVTAVPGPSAALAALQLSGLPADRFLFAGFLPVKGAARRAVLKELEACPATLVFYEAPHRVPEALADMAAVLGNREAAVARELTKLHEEVARGRLFELSNRFAEAGPPKGEVVVVVAPPGAASPTTPEELDQRLAAAVAGGASIKDAAALIAAETGHPRREVYARALRLFRGRNEE